MKSAFFALTFLTSSLLASTSFGLVRMQAECTTADGAYEVSVVENQGTGPVRPSPGAMTATLKDAQGNEVLSAPVEMFRGLGSISFGRPQYRDIQTSGDLLNLEGPSTNFKNYILTAVINGQPLHDENLSCKIFYGELL